ncbi:MAG: hypothetical protein DI565_18760 [Ancylobacter novellus]|uniref:DUF937 domain-containing protein n=1 Tax=Ancylobacter novellus TaxID=921 RepID=A0A2W5K1U5_ANCNO|nr:MAG: hypothetical protein DI565_18760 [Ancylobacter novellus]
MGLFDQIKGSLGDTIAQAGAAALPSIIERMVPGGLQGVLDQLQNSGYGAQVKSWLGRGENQPITVDDLRAALDNEQVRAIADRFGISVDKALEILAGRLPQAIDEASPNGVLERPAV